MQNINRKMDAIGFRRRHFPDTETPHLADLRDSARQNGLNAVHEALEYSGDTSIEAEFDRRGSRGANDVDSLARDQGTPFASSDDVSRAEPRLVQCPYCLEQIREGAFICRHCRSALGDHQRVARGQIAGGPQHDEHTIGSFSGSTAIFQAFIAAQVACVLEKYARFRGRASRSEFWYFYLGVELIFIVLGALTPTTAFNYPRLTFAFLILLPQLAVGVRRLHDVNRSGAWLLLGLTGFGIVPLIYWWTRPSDPNPNRFGPPPLTRPA